MGLQLHEKCSLRASLNVEPDIPSARPEIVIFFLNVMLKLQQYKNRWQVI